MHIQILKWYKCYEVRKYGKYIKNNNTYSTVLIDTNVVYK